MPSSLTDLQNYWTSMSPTKGSRFNADEAISLVVDRCMRYEAALQQIALNEADAARVAMMALGAPDFDPEKPRWGSGVKPV